MTHHDASADATPAGAPLVSRRRAHRASPAGRRWPCSWCRGSSDSTERMMRVLVPGQTGNLRRRSRAPTRSSTSTRARSRDASTTSRTVSGLERRRAPCRAVRRCRSARDREDPLPCRLECRPVAVQFRGARARHLPDRRRHTTADARSRKPCSRSTAGSSAISCITILGALAMAFAGMGARGRDQRDGLRQAPPRAPGSREAVAPARPVSA